MTYISDVCNARIKNYIPVISKGSGNMHQIPGNRRVPALLRHANHDCRKNDTGYKAQTRNKSRSKNIHSDLKVTRAMRRTPFGPLGAFSFGL